MLVRSERPGEALRYFAQAQAMGLDPARFAGDRGLAYDLIGEQERAQRDYRLALRQGPDEEITRRYALSLGISGKRDMALEQLDPLLRETDRGAWRARAFVLAMAGDVPGAERIAITMMPPGMAEGLQPFFRRLPSLPATDRAFAVHFGEVVATPERIADARLSPPLPALGPDPYAPTQVVRMAAAPVPERTDKRRRGKQKPGRVQLAAAVVPTAAPTALPPPPAYTGQPVAIYEPPRRAAALPNATARANAQQLASISTATPVAVTNAPPLSRSAAPSRTVALARNVRATPVAVARAPDPQLAVVSPAPERRAAAAGPVAVADAVVIPTAAPIAAVRTATSTIPVASAAPVAAPPARVIATPAPAMVAAAPATATTASVVGAPAPVLVPVAAPASVPGASPVPTQLAATDVTPSTPAEANATARVFATSEPAASVPAVAMTTAAPPVTGPRDAADAILARIIAGLSIPAAELEVRAPVRIAPAQPAASSPAPDVLAEAQAKEARDAAAAKVVADKVAGDRKKVALDRKALAAKKLADEKKAADAKAVADAKKAARANPARIWVQVSGGANEGDLPKAYAAVKGKAPSAFAGRSGWSTPLRATNRVLTGPFKTDAEARAFVNSLAKQGVSAFTFSSDDGQPVTRLPAR